MSGKGWHGGRNRKLAGNIFSSICRWGKEERKRKWEKAKDKPSRTTPSDIISPSTLCLLNVL